MLSCRFYATVSQALQSSIVFIVNNSYHVFWTKASGQEKTNFVHTLDIYFTLYNKYVYTIYIINYIIRI